MVWLMYSQPGIRAGGYAKSSPPCARFLRGSKYLFYGGLDPPDMGGHSVKLRRNSRPAQHVDPHPDLGDLHAVCSGTQTIRRGITCPLSNKMAGGVCTHRQRQGSRTISLPRPDPTDPRPGNLGYLPSHARTHTILPEPTLH